LSPSSWPEEIASLRKLKTLTFEGNDQLKELPPLAHFPDLKTLKVHPSSFLNISVIIIS
jgi:hypothetical protein